MPDSKAFAGKQILRTLTTAVSLAVGLPPGSREHKFTLQDPAAAWTFGFDQTVVDAGNGFPVAAGDVLSFVGPFMGDTIFVRHATGGDEDLNHVYLVPR